MKHNLSNPKCPDCNGISFQLDTIITKQGKNRRYKCLTCGRAFTENTKDKKLEEIQDYKKEKAFR